MRIPETIGQIFRGDLIPGAENTGARIITMSDDARVRLTLKGVQANGIQAQHSITEQSPCIHYVHSIAMAFFTSHTGHCARASR